MMEIWKNCSWKTFFHQLSVWVSRLTQMLKMNQKTLLVEQHFLNVHFFIHNNYVWCYFKQFRRKSFDPPSVIIINYHDFNFHHFTQHTSWRKSLALASLILVPRSSHCGQTICVQSISTGYIFPWETGLAGPLVQWLMVSGSYGRKIAVVLLPSVHRYTKRSANIIHKMAKGLDGRVYFQKSITVKQLVAQFFP